MTGTVAMLRSTAWTTCCRLVGFTGIAGVVVSAFTPLPNVLTQRLGSHDERPGDAIVVLAGAGVAAEGVLSTSSLRRALYGIMLFRRGLAPLLVLSAGSRDEADARVELAQALGVPSDRLVALPGAETTRDEAVLTWKRLAPMGARRIVLVTDPAHVPRSRAFFRRIGFEVHAVASDDVSIGSTAPGERLELMRRALAEALAAAFNVLGGSD